MTAAPDEHVAPSDEGAPPGGAAGSPRRVVFVVGSGRSGTTTVAGALRALGMHIPQPEVAPDESSPGGYGESQWVVDFHDQLLRRANVSVTDARPTAWFATGKLSNYGPLRIRLKEWLEPQFANGDELVIKDPRLIWFIGLWRAAALRSDAQASYVTMLRPVTEVVGSRERYHDAKTNEVQRTAAWVNTMLHTERATRGASRAFLRYHDLLTDWTVPLHTVGERFDLDAVRLASANDIRAVHAFVDPTLRHISLTWDDIAVPARLREIAEEAWQHLDRLVDPEHDVAAVHVVLDQLRAAYAELYTESEAIAHSSAQASYRDGVAAGRKDATPAAPKVAARAKSKVKRALGRGA